MAIETNRGITIQEQKSYEINRPKVEDDRRFIPKQFKDVAAGMEQQFAQYMLEQMNKSVDNSESEESTGMDYYKGLKTTEQAKILTNQNGLGLQDMILNQVYPKRLRSELGLKQYEAQVNRLHHNLPKLEASKKNDMIVMGKNDSASLSNVSDNSTLNKEGDLK